MKFVTPVIAVSASLIVAAAPASAAQTGAASQTLTCFTENRNAATLPYIQLTEPAPQQPEVAVKSGFFAAVSNAGGPRGYTRLLIDFVPCGGGARDYSVEGRNAFKRFFVGKITEKFLTVKAEVVPTDVSATVSLAKIGRDSTKKGDIWTTDISNERLLLPYFRVDNNTSVRLTFEFASNKELRWSATSDALDIITRAASAISPTTALITEENKSRFNDAATFVDRSISDLMKIAVTEKLTKDAHLQQDSEIELARITLFAPDVNMAIAANPVPIGQWVVSAAPVIRSVFRPAEFTGQGPLGPLSSAAIMNFRVADNKTLQGVLAGKESIASARDSLVKAATAAAQAEPAAALCRAIALEADRIGFSPADVGLALWAYVHNQMAEAGRRSVLDSACRQVENYPAGSAP